MVYTPLYVEREDRVCRVLLGELGWTDGSNLEELRGEVDAIGELIIRLTRWKKQVEGMIVDICCMIPPSTSKPYVLNIARTSFFYTYK